jgi:hypothetical protein
MSKDNAFGILWITGREPGRNDARSQLVSLKSRLGLEFLLNHAKQAFVAS